MFGLALSLVSTQFRARRMAEQLTAELRGERGEVPHGGDVYV